MQNIEKLELLKQNLNSYKEEKKEKLIKEKEDRIKKLIKEKDANKVKKIKLVDSIKAFLLYPIMLLWCSGMALIVPFFIFAAIDILKGFSWLIPLSVLFLFFLGVVTSTICILLDKKGFIRHYKRITKSFTLSKDEIDFMIETLNKSINKIKNKKYNLSLEEKEESVDFKTFNLLSSCLIDKEILVLYASEKDNNKITYGQLEKFISIMEKKMKHVKRMRK